MDLCPKCRSHLATEANFCAECGFSVATTKSVLGTRHYLLILLLTAALFIFAWSIQQHFGGEPPTKSYAEVMGEGGITAPVDAELRDSLPKDIVALNALAIELELSLGKSEQQDPKALIKYGYILEALLEKTPNDPDLLLKNANFSFNHQSFGKSATLLRRYLEIKPDDWKVKAQLASALTFTNQLDEAIAILRQVIAHDPKTFHGYAYLAIALSQQGEREAAISAGDTALTLAPSAEARDRFAKFLATIKQEPMAADEEAIVAFISKHPIAGSKFLRSSMESGALSLFFKDFPMSAMPAFAKEKFFGEIKSQARSVELKVVKQIVFVDEESGSAMDTLQLP